MILPFPPLVPCGVPMWVRLTKSLCKTQSSDAVRLVGTANDDELGDTREETSLSFRLSGSSLGGLPLIFFILSVGVRTKDHVAEASVANLLEETLSSCRGRMVGIDKSFLVYSNIPNKHYI